MKPLPLTAEIEAVARRIVWFEEPSVAVADPIRFLAYAMTYATHEDMRAIRSHVTDSEFCEALDKAPPGIIDRRSWAYWNSKFGRWPVPPAPERLFTVDAGVTFNTSGT